MLHCPRGYQPRVASLVAEFLRDGVTFIGVVGQDCEKIEDIIDELAVGDGTREPYSLLTSSHPGETPAEAIEFAEALTGEYAGVVQVIEV